MVGKPNFPSDVEQRDDLLGHSIRTPGLNALDQEREGSMADEGGTSGAVMESQDGDIERSPTSRRPFPDARALHKQAWIRRAQWVGLGALTGLTIAGLFLPRRKSWF